MLKTVAVMDGLEELAGVLRKEGIKVVDVADTGATISAIIYSAKVKPTEKAAKRGQSLADGGGGTDDMVLMLNADELSVEEIVARVKSAW